MKVHQIIEAPKTKIGDRKEPKLFPDSSNGKPLKGQSLKLNGVNYQWKGAQWIVTDTSEFKGKNPPKKGAIADRNAKALLNQQAAKINGVKIDPPKVDSPKGNAPKVDSPKAVASNIDGGGEAEAKNKSLFKKLKDKVPKKLIDWMRRHVSRLFGATVAGWIMKGFAISGIVSLYNSYFDEIYTLVEAKENGASNDKLKSIHKKMGEIREKLIIETTDLMVGSIGMAFGTGGVLVGGMVVGVVASFLSGGAAAPPSILWGIFVGAVAAVGAYEGAMQVCKMESAGKLLGLDVSIYDYTKNKLGTTWLTPDNLADTLREVGAEQTFINYVVGLSTNPLMQYSSPYAMPGINSGVSIGTATGATIGKLKDLAFDHKDHGELNRIMELSGVVQEKKLEKLTIDDLPDELKKFAQIGFKNMHQASKKKKST